MTLMLENIPEYRFVHLKVCLGVYPILCIFLLLKRTKDLYTPDCIQLFKTQSKIFSNMNIEDLEV